MEGSEDRDRLIRRTSVLTKTLSAMGGRLEASLKMLSAIAGLTEVPLKFPTMADAAAGMLEILCREVEDIDRCSILRYLPETETLKLLAAKGAVEIMGQYEGIYNKELAFRPGEGVAGLVFAENKPLFWDRTVSQIELLKSDTLFSNPESLACLPLSTPTQRIGVLNVSFMNVRPFDPPRKRHLIVMGGVVANILQIIALQTELDEKTASLRSREKELAERKRAEAALRRSEERFKAQYNAIPLPTFTWGIHGRQITLLNYNHMAREATDDRISDFVGKTAQEIYSDRPDIVADIQRCHAEKTIIRRETTFSKEYLGKAGQYVFTYSYVPTGLVMQHTENVTEKKALQKQLIRSERFAATGQLAASIAHEINSPLQAIRFILDTVRDTHGGDTELQENIGLLTGAFGRIKNTVNILLDLNRPGKEEKGHIDINRIIEQTVSLTQNQLKKHKIKVRFNLHPAPLYIHASPQQMSQVFLNLINNAVDAVAHVPPPLPEKTGKTEPFHRIDFITERQKRRSVHPGFGYGTGYPQGRPASYLRTLLHQKQSKGLRRRPFDRPGHHRRPSRIHPGDQCQKRRSGIHHPPARRMIPPAVVSANAS